MIDRLDNLGAEEIKELTDLLAAAWATASVELVGAEADIGAVYRSGYSHRRRELALSRARQRSKVCGKLLRQLHGDLPPVLAGRFMRRGRDPFKGHGTGLVEYNAGAAALEMKRLARWFLDGRRIGKRHKRPAAQLGGGEARL